MTTTHTTRKPTSLALTLALFCGTVAQTCAAAPSFYTFGFDSDSSGSQRAWAISPDGGTVVGGSSQAFRYSVSGGYQLLPFSSSFFKYSARGVASGGGVIALENHENSADPYGQESGNGYLLTAPATFTELVDSSSSVPRGLRVSPYSNLSADGSVVVGTGTQFVGGSTAQRARKYSAATGLVDLGTVIPVIPLAPSPEFNFATVVTADGSQVFGLAGGYTTPTTISREVFRHTAATGMTSLFPVPTTSFILPSAADSTGSTLLLTGFSDLNNTVAVAARWTQATGLVPLPEFSFADALTSDGAIVGGVSSAAFALGADRGLLWSEATGGIDITTYAATLGLNLDGWTINSVDGISADGSAICGSMSRVVGAGGGTETGSYLINGLTLTTVPEPSALAVPMLLAVLSAPRRRR